VFSTDAQGFKFSPNTPRVINLLQDRPSYTFVELEFQLVRSLSTVLFSLFVLALNWMLSLLLGFLALQVVLRNRTVAAGMLGPPISLLFALPNLRNAQPGSPPVGATSDVLGFFWYVFPLKEIPIRIIFLE
jgi:hypothetical protein